MRSNPCLPRMDVQEKRQAAVQNGMVGENWKGGWLETTGIRQPLQGLE